MPLTAGCRFWPSTPYCPPALAGIDWQPVAVPGPGPDELAHLWHPAPSLLEEPFGLPALHSLTAILSLVAHPAPERKGTPTMSRTRAFIITATPPRRLRRDGRPRPHRRPCCLYVPARHALPGKVYAEDSATFRTFVQAEAADAEARREQELAQAWNMPDANW